MRNLLLCGWLMLPIGAWAYHEGPGQDRVARDEVAAVLADAEAAATAGDHADAVAKFEQALASLPKDDRRHQRRIRLELAKSRMEAHQLPVAREELDALVEELAVADDGERDPALLAGAREALANSQYYMTWLMRLEGLTREQWEPEIEAARQNWRLLAETASDPKSKQRHEEDLESAVKLARLELQDLQGLPLPSQ